MVERWGVDCRMVASTKKHRQTTCMLMERLPCANLSCGLDVRQENGNRLGRHIVTAAHSGSHATCTRLEVQDRLR
jgi:hypothetical protein